MKLSSDALEYMQGVAKECADHEYRNMKAMMFDRGKSAPVHNELAALGLLKLMGTKGSAWVRTDAGAEWIMENRVVD